MAIAQVKVGTSKVTLMNFIRAFPIHVSLKFSPNSYGKTVLGQ